MLLCQLLISFKYRRLAGNQTDLQNILISNFNFYSLDVVSRYRGPQLQVGKNYYTCVQIYDMDRSSLGALFIFYIFVIMFKRRTTRPKFLPLWGIFPFRLHNFSLHLANISWMKWFKIKLIRFCFPIRVR